MQTDNQTKIIDEDIIGTKKYFVHKGTWKNDYEWRIQEIKITGLTINEKGEYFVSFSFNCTGYDYPLSYLKDTLAKAKIFAIREINKEKTKQIKSIKLYKEPKLLPNNKKVK